MPRPSDDLFPVVEDARQSQGIFHYDRTGLLTILTLQLVTLRVVLILMV
jgi:hypothetical protein